MDMAVLEWTRALGRHSPRCIKGPPLRSEEKISSPELLHRVMQPQDDPNNDTQYQCMFLACPPSEGIRLTTPVGDIRFQDEAAQSVDMIMVNPPYWPETHPVLGDLMWVDAPLFSQGQWYSPLRPPYTYTLPEDPNGLFPPNVGENLDRATAAGYGGNIPQEGVGPSNGDLRVSPRYGIDPEGHIHLTTNISMTWPRVSYPHLVEEVCHRSASKTRWY